MRSRSGEAVSEFSTAKVFSTRCLFNDGGQVFS
jgi:hypothetical protein